MIRGLRPKLFASIGTAVTVFALTAGSASAHFCYFNEANVKAEVGRAGSNGFVSFGDLAAHFLELCPEGAEYLADAAGVTTSTLINAHGLMAGGAMAKGKTVKPISHLDFGAIGAAEEAARAECT